MAENKQTIGFIGIGVMGNSMAGHLLQSGHEVFVYTRTKEKAQNLLDQGALWADSPKEMAGKADVIISIVGYPSDVEEIYLGEQGIIEHASKGTFLIDMTTSTPSLAIRIYEEAEKKGLYSLDAPVSGGDVGAKNATLTIMAGGDEDAFNKVKPILAKMGTNIQYQGKAGSGQHTKMSNQIAIASNMIGVCEAIVYAEKAGLDAETVLKSISAGSAGSWSLSNLAPRMINGNFEPGFYIKHFIKDMKIAIDEAEKMELHLPGLSLAKSLYEKLAESGEENSGTHALYKYWSK
ncbi:NAD(P)-dependent oxidoreductase [Peribacillus deserti]|uniref:Oxidoreductase n=1 Tax=Peribacillus deserti TaxID=673318 RepID=A0A2N5M3I6_9BACI|nr:NAD(P)-dependent oxidoreductase [Peribacillus deserti]PLT28929.1 oxidoreductase [Peribacillus deserti]